jgi:hypothetical protein
MKVFISWSGKLSHEIAKLLREWLPCVIQAAEPWLSSQDIAKGSVGVTEINSQLEGSSVGIICITSENMTEPWILFEAGALSKGVTKNRVCTLLINLAKSTDLKPPLGNFQWTMMPNKDEMLKLVKSINDGLKEHNEKPLSDQVLAMTYEQMWPKFDEGFQNALSNCKPTTQKHRPQEEIIEEILENSRQAKSGLEKLLNSVQLEKDAREAALKYARATGMARAFGDGAFGRSTLGISAYGEGLGLDYLAPPIGSSKIGSAKIGGAKITTTPPEEDSQSES